MKKDSLNNMMSTSCGGRKCHLHILHRAEFGTNPNPHPHPNEEIKDTNEKKIYFIQLKNIKYLLL